MNFEGVNLSNYLGNGVDATRIANIATQAEGLKNKARMADQAEIATAILGGQGLVARALINDDLADDVSAMNIRDGWMNTAFDLAGTGLGLGLSKMGSGSINTGMVDRDVARINAYEKANPFTSMSGRSYNNWSGWVDPATGRRY